MAIGFEERARREEAAATWRRSAAQPSSRDDFGIEQAALREWESSPALREEFTSYEAFLAFRKAEARGLIRIISRGT
jgi:hypothetical protein